jgi:hypothetical protein
MKSIKLSKIILLALPLFLIFYLFIPKRTITELPSTQSASLADSIPIEYYQQLIVVERQGNRIYEDGKAVTYLEYETDANNLLRTIARLPFSKYAARADTVCLEIGFYGFAALRSSLSDEERQAGSFFWSATPQSYQRYECIKGDEKHTLLINRTSDQVLHRIEYT